MEGPREGGICWKSPVAEAFENYLGVALIRSGDSVTIGNKIFPEADICRAYMAVGE